MNASVAILLWLGACGTTGQAFPDQPPTARPIPPISRPISSQQPPVDHSAVEERDPSRDAAALLRDAIVTLEGRQSVTARIRMKVDLFGQELLGSGYYRQQRAAEGLLFRLELNLQAKAGREPNSLLWVCDGRYLWTWRQLGGGESLDRIDIVRVVRMLEEAGEMRLLDKRGGMSALGGLPRLLRWLRAAFRFDQFDEVRLNNQMAGWRISGRWKEEKPVRGSAEAHQESPETGRINPSDFPRHLPGVVVLFFGQEDLFPHRIEFRHPASEAGQGGEASRAEPMVSLELFEVNLNVPVNPARFVYKPGDLDATDRTDDFLESLRLE